MKRGIFATCALTLLLSTSCARMGPPAGGPEDKVPPKLIGTVPDSLGSYPTWKQDVEFRFDEVVFEGTSPNLGTGTGDLEKLVLLSPSRAVPVVRWKRDRITVHPKEGWHRNRVYRVELLPGLTDLRRNKSDTTAILTFSTGGPPPTDTLRGLVIDWVAGRVARAALVELMLEPDSLVYRAVADSGGRYEVGPLPRGRWTVFGALDQNKNLRRERRESYDSAAVAEGTPLVPALWLIPRDTVGPRILSITPIDSVSATIQFSQPLDPGQNLDSLSVRFLHLPDSTPTPYRSLRLKTIDDSLQKISQARADSARAAADTLKADTSAAKRRVAPEAPRPAAPRGPGRPALAPVVDDPEADSIIATRPRLTDKLVLRVDSAFPAEAKYAIDIRGIRSAAGVAGEARAGLAIPKAKPPEKQEAKDSTAVKPDSLPLPPAPQPRPR